MSFCAANGSTHNFTAPNAIMLLLGSDIHKDSLALSPPIMRVGDIVFISSVVRSALCLDFGDRVLPLNSFVSRRVFTPNLNSGSRGKGLAGLMLHVFSEVSSDFEAEGDRVWFMRCIRRQQFWTNSKKYPKSFFHSIMYLCLEGAGRAAASGHKYI